MFFIRGMVTGKWICFYAVRKVTDNGWVLPKNGIRSRKRATETRVDKKHKAPTDNIQAVFWQYNVMPNAKTTHQAHKSRHI